MTIRWVSAGLLLVTLGCSASAPVPPSIPKTPIPPGTVRQQIEALLQRDEGELIAFRRDLHQHPELSGFEVRTAQRVADELRLLGLEVRTNVGGHGVVALLRGARPGPLVAFRADMDAMRSNSRDPVDFPSLTPGIRHICGHDIHTTVGVALARALHQVRDSLAGRVLFIFQPAEETATGAATMLASGVFGGESPTAIYGFHTAPYQVGVVASTAGPMMAGRDRFSVRVEGAAGVRAAMDLILARLSSLSTISQDQVGMSQPTNFALVSLSPVTGDDNALQASGTVTVASQTVRDRIRATVVDSLRALIGSLKITTTYDPKVIPGVTNDSLLASAALTVAAAALGPSSVATVSTIPPAFSEDFGAFQERVPGVFFYLGVANRDQGWSGLPHSDSYVADERAIATGVRAMSAVLLRHLLPAAS